VVEHIRPFLMFEGRAEEAMAYYAEHVPGAEIVEMVRFAAGQSGAEGSVLRGVMILGGLTVQFFDSAVHHGFTFTPSISFFITCESHEEIARLAQALGDGGGVLMELADYGFSRQFTWVNDRFGVSWQLNLP
jgi:predicted 3-demethylubiquinone-9 3-methyltransferase (glyoxalase superfamily)